jgi:hypothetical protein
MKRVGNFKTAVRWFCLTLLVGSAVMISSGSRLSASAAGIETCRSVTTNDDFTNVAETNIEGDLTHPDNMTRLAPWWLPTPLTQSHQWGGGIGPDVASARGVDSPNFGPALSGNVLVKQTLVAGDSGDSAARYPLGANYVAAKFFAAFPSHRMRITFYARKVVDSPATFSWYRQVNGSEHVFEPLPALATTSWTKIEAYVGTYIEDSYGALGVFQDLAFDPNTALPILPTQRGAIAVSNFSVADCGTFNGACSIDSGGSTVCGVSLSRDVPVGYGYLRSVRWGKYLERGDISPAGFPAYDELHRNRLSGSADQLQQWSLVPSGNPNLRRLVSRNPFYCSTIERSLGYQQSIMSKGMFPLECALFPREQEVYVTDSVNVNRSAHSVEGSGTYRVRSSKYFREYEGGPRDSEVMLAGNGCLSSANSYRVEWRVCDATSIRYAQAWSFEAGDPSGAIAPNPLGSLVLNAGDPSHRAIGSLLEGTLTGDPTNPVLWGGRCTATYVRRPGDLRGAIVSADHCSSDGSVWAFSPGYENGTSPYGVYFFTKADIQTTGAAPPERDVIFASFSNRFADLVDVGSALALRTLGNEKLDRLGSGLTPMESGVAPLTVGFRPPSQMMAVGSLFAYGFPITMGYQEQLVMTNRIPRWNTRVLEIDSLMGGGSSGGPAIIGNTVFGVRSQGSTQPINGLRATYSRLTADTEPLYLATNANGAAR